MGIFTRAESTSRDAFPYPQIPTNGSLGSYAGDFANARPADADSAMRKVAIWSSIDLIAGLVSMMPVGGLIGEEPNTRRTSLPRFFDNPDGSGQGWQDWCYQLLWSWLSRGNVVGRVLDRDAAGRMTQVELAHPDQVNTWRDTRDGAVHWRFAGQEVPASEVWHRRMYPVPGRLMGMSPIERHAVTIGQGLAAGAFGWRFFTDGAHPSAILQNTMNEKVPQPVAAAVKQRFLAAVRGTREPVVLGQGWEYKAIQVTPEESQFLDTQRMTSAECARIYGPGMAEVLGYETGGSLTYATIEGRRLDLLAYVLDRWLLRVETLLSADVMTRPTRIRLDRKQILSTDILTRYRAGQIAVASKWLAPSEVRASEGLPPMTDAQIEEIKTSPTVPPATPVTVEAP